MKQIADFIKKNHAILIVLCAVMAVCLFFCGQKEGLSIDEIYSHGLSNSYRAPFIEDVLGGEIGEELLTREQMWDYLTVDRSDAFSFGSVYYNQTQDVHPPLHYWVMHLFSSFFPDTLSMWVGLSMNASLFLASLIVFYLLVKKMFGSAKNAAVSTALYGLSSMSLSAVLMIRMYMLLTLLTVVLAYVIVCILEKPSWKKYLALGLTILAGMLTQYYFVIYAFFVCAAVVVRMLIRKDYKNCLWFSVSAFGGVLAMLAVYPACIDHLFADKLVSAGTAVDNLGNVGEYASKIYTYSVSLVYGALIAVLTGCAACVVLAIRFRPVVKNFREQRFGFRPLLLVLPAVATLLLAAVVSPVVEMRYIYNIVPIFVIAVSYVLHMTGVVLDDSRPVRIIKTAAPFAVLIPLVAALAVYAPSFLCENHEHYDRQIEPYADCPCVYMDDGYICVITQDMMQLMQFEDVYITADTNSQAMKEYIEAGETAVVFIDTNEFWSSGFDSAVVLEELLNNTSYDSYELLYKYNLSETYVLTRSESPAGSEE